MTARTPVVTLWLLFSTTGCLLYCAQEAWVQFWRWAFLWSELNNVRCLLATTSQCVKDICRYALFNYSMQQRPSWGANKSSVTEQILPILWNPRFVTAFTTASHLSLLWARSIQFLPPFHFFKIHFNMLILFTSGSSEWSLSLRGPYQSPVCTCPPPHICYMPCPSQSSWSDHPNDIWWGVQSIKFFFR